MTEEQIRSLGKCLSTLGDQFSNWVGMDNTGIGIPRIVMQNIELIIGGKWLGDEEYMDLVGTTEATCEERNVLREQRDELRNAIETHRTQKADDRCIEDDDKLYEVLGDGVKCDHRVGNKIGFNYNANPIGRRINND